MTLFKSQEERRINRRRLNRRRLISFTLTAVGAYFGYRWWRFRPVPVSQRQTRYVTPNQEFFNVSIRPGFRPAVDAESYRLIVQGPAGVVNFSLDEIRGLPQRTIMRTLACVGNGVGGTGIGNAEWRATPLDGVLNHVRGAAGEAWWVTFRGMDGFYSSVPLAVASDPDTVLAWEMNGQPLPLEHGYPLRVLIPDRYGMKQPRWLERIEIAETGSGYWERRGWCRECRVRMTARIDSVRAGDGGIWTVRGIAFAGGAGVERVEISADGGAWQPAVLQEPAQPNAWSTWACSWRPASSGEHVLAVRVADCQGRFQDEVDSGPYPSGASGLHRVIVQI